jgi:hypothetical protein
MAVISKGRFDPFDMSASFHMAGKEVSRFLPDSRAAPLERFRTSWLMGVNAGGTTNHQPTENPTMRITRIELEGHGHTATIERRRRDDEAFIYVELRSRRPATRPNAHWVCADQEEDLFSMAEILQHALDGYRGTNADINDYYRELARFAS